MSRKSKLKRDARIKQRRMKRVRLKERNLPDIDNVSLIYVDYDEHGVPCRIGQVEMDEGMKRLIDNNFNV